MEATAAKLKLAHMNYSVKKNRDNDRFFRYHLERLVVHIFFIYFAKVILHTDQNIKNGKQNTLTRCYVRSITGEGARFIVVYKYEDLTL